MREFTKAIVTGVVIGLIDRFLTYPDDEMRKRILAYRADIVKECGYDPCIGRNLDELEPPSQLSPRERDSN
jgi:hypothetical protein